jgi:para-nitrobenzyl esterase
MDSSRLLQRRQFLSASALGMLLPSLAAGATAPATVKVRNGTLRGMHDQGVFSFKGVPYAADTGGANRFRAPQPVANWTGVRDATAYGPLCPQVPQGMGEMFAWYDAKGPMGEACCVLNVFTPGLDAKARRPVMFFIHGGGYINGGGATDAQDGTHLASAGDVVVVTINHRLNAFGFTDLSHLDPEKYRDSANAGILDIVAALQWVRDNIASMGGDPGNVTVFGQSGGGSKIMVLLGMPSTRGLFHRAISMSGAAGLAIDPAPAMRPYVDVLVKETGAGPVNLGPLQSLSWEQLLAARTRAVIVSELDGARPVIDGRHVVATPMSAQGLPVHAQVPLLLGSTKTEASLFFMADMRNFKLTETQMRERLRSAFNIDDAKVDAIARAYRQSDAAMTPSEILIAKATDVQFRLPLEGAAVTKSDSAGQAPVYMYLFEWQIRREGGVLGTPHAVDIPFAFGNIDKAVAMTSPGDGAAATEQNLMAAFLAFARTGNPGNKRMPAWLPYNRETRTTMRVNARCETANDYRGAARLAVADLKIDPFNRAALYRY